MIEFETALASITKNLKPILDETKFSYIIPDGVQKGETPVAKDGNVYTILMTNQNNSIKLFWEENKFNLEFADGKYESDIEFVHDSTLLFDPENADDSDVKFIVNEVEDTIREKFGEKKQEKGSNKKLPNPVSKASVKSGSAFFDTNTFANRFTVMYGELRDEYKDNLNRYGQFLAEEFFSKFGAPAVIKTIKENNPQRMKKLFTLLNEMYDGGDTEVQDIIVVTILGEINNDQVMLANCVDYMSTDLCPLVIHVNKFLATSKGKKAREELNNPPLYRPKKAKKTKAFANKMMGQ